MKDTAADLLGRILRLANEHVTEIKTRADRVEPKTGALNGYSATDARTLQDYAKICLMTMKDSTPGEISFEGSDEELIAAAYAAAKKLQEEQDYVDDTPQ